MISALVHWNFAPYWHLCNLHFSWTTLHWTCQIGHYAITALLLDAGVDVNALTYEQETPLILASENGHLEVVKQLIGNNATIDHNDAEGLVHAK